MVVCTHCKIDKPESEFGKSKYKSNGLNSWCKKCTNDSAAKTRDPINRKNYFMEYLYKISIDDYNKLLNEQNGVCAICERPEHMPRKTDLSVDHDKTTGKVRGLLCSNCNRALGFIEENPIFAENLLKYIRDRCSSVGNQQLESNNDVQNKQVNALTLE